MSITQQAIRFGQRRLVRRAGRVIPVLGAVLAVATIASIVRRKGLARGLADSALNAIPFVGGLKLAAEVVRGREFIGDKTGKY